MVVEVADVAGFAAALAALSLVFTVRACCRCTGGWGGVSRSFGGHGSAAGTTFAAKTVCRGFRLTCFAAWTSGRALLEADAGAARSAVGNVVGLADFSVLACAGG
eukprot:1831824-Amphidinium_carterae.1